jgi:hypothetical protein
LGFLLFAFSLLVTFFLDLLREFFVSGASDSFALNLDLGGIGASFDDIILGPLGVLDVVAVEEMGDGDVALFASLDLFAEELVFDEVGVGKVVFNLGLDFVVVCYHRDFKFGCFILINIFYTFSL